MSWFKRLKEQLKQPSTQKGLALMVSGVALAAGHPEIITASVTESGVQYGGIAGTLLPVALGIYETIRNENKGL